MTPSTPRDKSPRRAELTVWVLCFALAGGSLAWTVLWASHGFDFTDEGFYLNWISHPDDFSGTTTYFGYAYHPVYDLVRGNVFALRSLNVAITWGPSVVLVWSFLSTPKLAGRLATITGPRRLLLSLTLGSASLLNFVAATATPNYNTLAYQGTVLMAWGLVVGVYSDRRRTVGLAAIAFGGWLAFLGKPPTAAALLLLASAVLVAERQFRVRHVAKLMAFLSGAAAATLVLMPASPADFLDELERGFAYNQLLGGHTTSRLLRVDQLPVEKSAFAVVLPLVLAALAAGVLLVWRRTRAWPVLVGWLLIAALGYGVAAAAVPSALVFDPDSGLLVFWLVPAAICETALAIGVRDMSVPWSPPTLARSATFALMPTCYALGSNNNFWVHETRAGLFLTLAGIVLLGPLVRLTDWTCVVPLSVTACGVTMLLLVSTNFFGYRQAPYAQANAQAAVSPSGGTLVVSSDAQSQLERIASIAKRYHVSRRVGVIDLSGDSPGYIYALGARPLGLAWLIGGYPGSDTVALRVLKRLPCEQLRNAWILVTRDGDRPLSPKVPSALGIAPLKDYASAGTIQRFDGSTIDIRYPVGQPSRRVACHAELG